jgi:hypothetical protein
MTRTTTILAVLAAACAFQSKNAVAQDGWGTPVATPPASQPPPPPPQTEILSESETTIESEGAGEVDPEGEGRNTNVNVAVGVRAETPAPAATPAPSSSTAERPNVGDAPPPGDEPELDRFLHGFRLGYLYIHDIESPVDSENPMSQPYDDRYGIRSPHMFMLGYELAVRIFGHDWLNMLLIGNVLIAGFEQSRFFPSANFMLGFEFDEMLQLGVGVSLTPTKDDPAHIVAAAGWTPRVGEFYLPIHFFFVPDINGHHKLGATLGVTF